MIQSRVCHLPASWCSQRVRQEQRQELSLEGKVGKVNRQEERKDPLTFQEGMLCTVGVQGPKEGAHVSSC